MTDNEMIALFEGYKHGEDHMKGYMVHPDDPGDLFFKLSAAEYNHSWDWLMPVVEKISKHVYEKTTHPHPGFEGQVIINYDRAYPRTFGLMTDEEVPRYMFRFNRGQLHFGATLIECAYAAVVQWIKDYNEGLYPKHPTP